MLPASFLMREFPALGGRFGEVFLRARQHWRQLKGVSGEDIGMTYFQSILFRKLKKIIDFDTKYHEFISKM